MTHLWEKVNDKYVGLAKRLEEECNWDWAVQDESISAQLLQDYQLFLLCKVAANDVQLKVGACRLLLSPTAEEDRVWHEHMLRPQLYFEMCKVLSGGGSDFKVLQHFPETAMDSAAMKRLRLSKAEEVKKSILKPKDQQRSADGEVGQKRPSASLSALVSPITSTPAGTSAADTDAMILNFVSADGSAICLRVRKHAKFAKMFDAVSSKMGVSSSSLRFLYDGKSLISDETPYQLEMEDGDHVSVSINQSGC
eukprot:gene32225-38976_t